uniref:3-oxo-5alpha-steroid 4-dehydrogenase (NADP(+)) n=1 Tax=Periophthalmus magnuspinnatus TaxID=409849 RepID=A0A3B3ZEJ6_9GOBI
MHCSHELVNILSCGMILAGLGHLIHHKGAQAAYGRHMVHKGPAWMVPAKVAWFLQEMPALLVPLLLSLSSHSSSSLGQSLNILNCLFYGRTFVYALLTRGRPFPVRVMVAAGFVCSLNGFLQSYYLLHCAQFEEEWTSKVHYQIGLSFYQGLILFYIGMAINIHSDYILRNLRKPGEVVYRIPKGGLFEYVSSANYLGEILEWFGYALSTWSLPTLSFALFSFCFIGPRAYYHHRFYQENFKDYPVLRKALIPFIC